MNATLLIIFKYYSNIVSAVSAGVLTPFYKDTQLGIDSIYIYIIEQNERTIKV